MPRLQPQNGTSRLRQLLDRTIAEAADEGVKLHLKDLTVLAPQNDPFRIDTPAGHRDGAWLAMHVEALGLTGRTLHLRGFHYALIGRPKPNGEPYANSDADWNWLQVDAAKAARWLGHLPFESIVDQRNAAPVIRLHTEPSPRPFISVGVDIEIPEVDDIVPQVDASDFRGVQPYKLVLFGEKSSLEPVLGPVAAQHQADLYLPTGEASDTMIHQMASVGAADGRPMRVFYFSDCDPAGWQMAISVARKLQAFQVAMFPDLDFEVRPVALTPAQVREYGLPSTPLKDAERRAGSWTSAMGVEQTEIDALASLRPDLLRRMARDALRPFFDHGLRERVAAAKEEWRARAQEILEEQLGHEQLERIRAEAVERLGTMSLELEAVNAALRVDTTDFDLPEIEIPEAEVDAEVDGAPLISSEWSHLEQSQRLVDWKAYRLNGDAS